MAAIRPGGPTCTHHLHPPRLARAAACPVGPPGPAPRHRGPHVPLWRCLLSFHQRNVANRQARHHRPQLPRLLDCWQGLGDCWAALARCSLTQTECCLLASPAPNWGLGVFRADASNNARNCKLTTRASMAMGMSLRLQLLDVCCIGAACDWHWMVVRWAPGPGGCTRELARRLQ